MFTNPRKGRDVPSSLAASKHVLVSVLSTPASIASAEKYCISFMHFDALTLKCSIKVFGEHTFAGIEPVFADQSCDIENHSASGDAVACGKDRVHEPTGTRSDQSGGTVVVHATAPHAVAKRIDVSHRKSV